MDKYKTILLVRSPEKLIKKSMIGYGWNVDFSKYNNAEDLIKNGFDGLNIGRKTNQIKRFYNLKEGDLVIIPVSRAIALAKVEGEKIFDENGGWGGKNQIKVNFLKNTDGEVAYIPRASLTTALQARLKLRMSNASLDDFRNELKKLASSLEEGKVHTWKEDIKEREEKAEEEFKKGLLERIKKGKVGLSAGGYGLEKLVTDLLKGQGYDANIQPKNRSSGIVDIDIIAKRVNLLTTDIEVLYIQVKHHNGNTSDHGIKQLEAFDPAEDEIALTRKIFITTGNINEETREKAEKSNIITLDGEQFVDWLYGNIESLESTTRTALGVSSIPLLV